MRSRIACGLLALAALSSLAVPAGAAGAAPRAGRLYAGIAKLNGQLALMGQGASGVGLSRKQALLELRFKNRDGYTISVVAFGQTVALDVSRARFRGAARGTRRGTRERVLEATYFAHGRVTPRSIEASFGELGRIDMRFRPSGRRLHSTRKAGCAKPTGAVIATLGSFEGELRFRGEQGYTAVDARRVPGRSVDLRALLTCVLGVSPQADATLPPARAPFGIRLPQLVAERAAAASQVPSVPTHPSAGPKTTTLVANRKEALGRTVFAAQVRDGGHARFLAAEEDSEGSIGVVRLVYARGAPPAFSFERTLAGAKVDPPAPFSGAAELSHGPRNEKSWSGSLAVSFLGAADVPLTGPLFNASLSQGL